MWNCTLTNLNFRSFCTCSDESQKIKVSALTFQNGDEHLKEEVVDMCVKVLQEWKVQIELDKQNDKTKKLAHTILADYIFTAHETFDSYSQESNRVSFIGEYPSSVYKMLQHLPFAFRNKTLKITVQCVDDKVDINVVDIVPWRHAKKSGLLDLKPMLSMLNRSTSLKDATTKYITKSLGTMTLGTMTTPDASDKDSIHASGIRMWGCDVKKWINTHCKALMRNRCINDANVMGHPSPTAWYTPGHAAAVRAATRTATAEVVALRDNRTVNEVLGDLTKAHNEMVEKHRETLKNKQWLTNKNAKPSFVHYPDQEFDAHLAVFDHLFETFKDTNDASKNKMFNTRIMELSENEKEPNEPLANIVNSLKKSRDSPRLRCEWDPERCCGWN